MIEDSKSPVIVLVDDEDMVVTSIKSFLTLETDYDVEGFTAPADALEFIKSNRVDVVVSDYLMPNMDGISLLAQVKEIQPEATRILLTGYADKENAIKAINDVVLYQYTEKPWESDDLKIVLRNGLEKKNVAEASPRQNRRGQQSTWRAHESPERHPQGVRLRQYGRKHTFDSDRR